jgi:uncharacterized DUF497 family protein
MPRVSFDIECEWDSRKAQTNRSKHGVSFELAASVFRDPHQLTIHDAAHSTAEDRWVTMGCDRAGKLLVVVHTWAESPKHAARVRIISARAATPRELKHYEGVR